jgi:hypothetical protein
MATEFIWTAIKSYEQIIRGHETGGKLMAQPIQGTQSGDTLYGTAAADKLLGHQGNDIFDLTHSTGTDTVDGQGGSDTAIFAGRFEDYVLSFKDTGNLKTTVSGHNLTAELKNVETLLFDNATYDVATHTAQITTVSVSDATSVGEGAADPHLNFTLSRSGDLSRALDVKYTLDGTATVGADYTAPAQYKVHFDAGSATAVLSLAVNNDSIFEGSETVGVHLVADSHYNFAPGAQVNASGTILDNDPPPVSSPVLHISDASAVEGGNLVFHVSIDAPTDHDITFQAVTLTGPNLSGGPPASFGTATPGNQPNGDYDGFPTPQTYTIHTGDTSVDISVHARSDFLTEGDETMSVRLQNATGATIQPGLGTTRGVGTIVDDPMTHVSFYADPNNVPEGSDLTFHFHRDVTTSALDLHYWMNTFPSGGATPGVDFTADNTTFTFVPAVPGSTDFMAGQDHWADASMIVHFNAGQSDATLVLHTTADNVAEGGPGGFEAFTVQLDFAANGSHVQYDGAASNQAYSDAGGTNPTQVNIGHIADWFQA